MMRGKNYVNEFNKNSRRLMSVGDNVVKYFIEKSDRLLRVEAGKEKGNNIETILIAYKHISEIKGSSEEMTKLSLYFNTFIDNVERNYEKTYYDRKMAFITKHNFEEYLSKKCVSSKRNDAKLKKFLKSKTEDFEDKLKLFEKFSKVLKNG